MFVFDAPLLLQLPLLLTFAKFVAETTSRSHQFARSKAALLLQKFVSCLSYTFYKAYLFLDLFRDTFVFVLVTWEDVCNILKFLNEDIQMPYRPIKMKSPFLIFFHE